MDKMLLIRCVSKMGSSFVALLLLFAAAAALLGHLGKSIIWSFRCCGEAEMGFEPQKQKLSTLSYSTTPCSGPDFLQ